MSRKNWEPSPGDVIDNRFEVKSHLGEGGIAKVWEGYDRRSGKKVAIKHLRFGSKNYQNAKNRMETMFQREVESLRKVENAGGHPYIIELKRATSERGTQFAVVDLINGKELDDTNFSVSEQEAQEIAHSIAEAVSFLHQNEIILRDLKPDNAMVQRDGSPKLIDFNTAKEYDTSVDDTARCPDCGEHVTPNDYICPNSACGRALDTGSRGTQIGGGTRDVYKPPETTTELAHLRQGPWTDVYALGKILHFMLSDTNTVPPKDGARPERFGVDLSRSNKYLDEVVERATKADYKDRYRNARVFATVLQRQDPEPPTQARLLHDQSGTEYMISPGDTIGRQGADGPAATITINDPGREKYISAVQVQFDTNRRGRWVVRDQSLNGTYVQNGSGWQRVLCENGRNRLQSKGSDPTDRHGNIPPETLELNDGAIIKLVDTTYNVTFEFEEVI